MAASNFMLGKASGGILSVSPADGTTNTSLVLPASGVVVATDVAVTDNAIARYDGTTGKVQNSGVVIDDSNNVGIGTSSPTGKLHISGDSSLVGVQAIFDDTRATVGKKYTLRSDGGSFALRDATAGADRITVDTNGNVGIGVTPSPWVGKAVEVGYTGTALQSIGIGISRVLANAYQGSGGNFYYANGGVAASMYEQSSGTHTWYKASSGTAGNIIPLTNIMSLDTSGNLLLTSGTGGLGYGTGAGGTVTQLTSKGTTVTLNKPSGTITLNSSALAGGAIVGFHFYNSTVAVTDWVGATILMSGVSDSAAYRCWAVVNNGLAGDVVIYLENRSAGSLSESVQIRFEVIKGVNA